MLLALPAVAFGRIKLITLPKRERVEIQLDNPSVTLVEEERVVPLVKGVEADDSGQYGLAFRFPVDMIDTEIGLYAMNIHSRLPYSSGQGGTSPWQIPQPYRTALQNASSIAALMLDAGEVKVKGVVAPEGCIDPGKFIAALIKRGAKIHQTETIRSMLVL